MYAIVIDGAKQLRVQEGDKVRIDQLGLEPGASVTLDKVLLIGEGDDVKVGKPVLDGASVDTKVIRELKDKKTWAFTYRRRKASSKRKKGHRQRYTLVEVTKIKG